MSRQLANPEHGKMVKIIAHSFDNLPAHVSVDAKGVGGSVRVATCRAVANLFENPALRRRRVGSFKLSVTVLR